MIGTHLLDYSEPNLNWNDKIDFLYSQQLKHWEMANTHYNQLKTLQKKTIFFNKFQIDIQFNPSRARSTCADLRKTTIKKRPCFLCSDNLPVEQKGYTILDKYLLLINPYPIFEKHLTISDYSHTPQLIENRISDMLDIAKALDSYTVFYNGAQCGASAPDHFHFQAASKGVMPIDNEIELIQTELGRMLYKNNEIKITQAENYIRSLVVFESENKELIENFFFKAIKQLEVNEQSNEPMMNLMASYKNDKYILFLFPRSKQRPSCYFNDESKRLLVSPASVELGGIIITPRNNDFIKINSNHLVEIYKEVSLFYDFQF